MISWALRNHHLVPGMPHQPAVRTLQIPSPAKQGLWTPSLKAQDTAGRETTAASSDS